MKKGACSRREPGENKVGSTRCTHPPKWASSCSLETDRNNLGSKVIESSASTYIIKMARQAGSDSQGFDLDFQRPTCKPSNKAGRSASDILHPTASS